MTARDPRGTVPTKAYLPLAFRPFEVEVDGTAHHVVVFNKVGFNEVVYQATCGKSGIEDAFAFRHRRPGSPIPTCPLCFWSIPNEVL